MLKKWYAKLLVLLAVVCAVAAAHPAVQAEAIPEETAQTQAEPDTAVQGAEMVASGTCGDNLTWSLDSAGTLTISGSGAMTSFGSNMSAPWYSRRNLCKSLVVRSGVTSVGSYAFWGYNNLTSITFPDSVTSIGSWAFELCVNLTSVTLPKGLTGLGISAFGSCRSLKSITFPDSLRSIGSGAFEGCPVTSVALPAGVTSIGEAAFKNCASLTSVTLSDSLTSVGRYAFLGCGNLTGRIEFPSTLTTIGENAFSNCTKVSGFYFAGAAPSVNACSEQSASFPKDSTLYFIYGKDGWVYDSGSNTWKGYKTGTWRKNSTDPAGGYCGETGDEASISWTFDGNGKLFIGGNGAMKNYSGAQEAPWASFADSIGFISIGSGITSIGNYAFYNCKNLTAVILRESLTRIGDSAFYSCGGLNGITFPDSLASIGASAFHGCSGLTSIILPDGLTNIGDSTFSGCWRLNSVTLPDGLTSIGTSAFSGCSDLTGIEFPNGLISIGASAFSGCYDLTGITLPDGLTSIGDSTFSGCWRLNSVTLPDGLTSIGASAFSDCTSLTSVILPDSLTSLGNSAFSSCTRLASISFPGGLTGIDKSMFNGCTGPFGITFRGDLTSIRDSAFSNCTGLASIMFLGRLDSVESSAFQGCTGLSRIALPDGLTSIGSSAFQGCTGLTDITLPDSLTSIGSSAFQGCTGLTGITLPDSLTSIGSSTFRDCTGLTGITFPAALKQIYSSAFENCTGLTSLAFPGSLTSIGDSAFRDCTGLTSIALPASLTRIESIAFYGCTGLTGAAFPDGLTHIGGSAFYGCTGLTSITLPRALTDLGTGAFARTKIAAFSSESDKFTVDKGGAVYDAYGSLRAYPAGSPQTTYAIQAGTTKIYGDMFYGAEHLVIVMVPDSVGSIGSHAFYSMAGLEAVYFAGRSPSLDSEAFERSTAKRLKIYYDPDTTGWTEANWPSEYFERIKWNPHQATGVELNAKTLTLALGAQQKLTATVLVPAAPENTAVTWASADMDVAAVFADGTVLGKKAGTTTVTVKTVDGGFTASCTVTVEPAPDGVMPVRLDSVCARPGNTVQVRLMLDRNPGFANLSLVIGYDADVMTLTKVENKVSGTQYIESQTLAANPYMLTWNSGTQNCTASGTLATLTFQIKNTAAYGVYPISVSFYKGLQGTYKDGVNVNYDQSRNALPLVYVGSSAEIRSYIPGDINGDGHVDSRDVLNLLRHLSGWKGITVVEEALDVNGDRESDFRDVTALLQYIAGWNVVLH